MQTHLSVEEEVLVALYGEKWERQEHQLGLTHQHITPQVKQNELLRTTGVSGPSFLPAGYYKICPLCRSCTV